MATTLVGYHHPGTGTSWCCSCGAVAGAASLGPLTSPLAFITALVLTPAGKLSAVRNTPLHAAAMTSCTSCGRPLDGSAGTCTLTPQAALLLVRDWLDGMGLTAADRELLAATLLQCGTGL